MLEYFQQILIAQCRSIPRNAEPVHRGLPAGALGRQRSHNGTFRWVDLSQCYFSPTCICRRDNEAFELRELNQRGGDERRPEAPAWDCPRTTLAYVPLVQKRCWCSRGRNG